MMPNKFLLQAFFLVILFQCTRSTKNVLFIIADDLRYQLNSLQDDAFPASEHPTMHTPNLDELASRSIVFHRAYVQYAVCSPSRASFLTSRRPDTTHVYDLKHNFRLVGGNFTTIPQFFKNNGYHSIGIGKIFHQGLEASGGEEEIAWTEPAFHGNETFESLNHTWIAIQDDVLQENPLIDKQLTDYGISTLRRVAPQALSGEKPFFIAIGLRRPHLPFVFPESMLKYYPTDSVQLPTNRFAPINMPDAAWSTYGEIRHYCDVQRLNVSGIINETFPDDFVLDLRRAYFSSVTWIDVLIGRLLNELNELGLDNNTVVSFIGDHGFNLGENGEYCKHTNFDIATHAPMMIHIPGKTNNGIITHQLNEFVDLFPTLVESVGFGELSECTELTQNEPLCTEGMSLLPLIEAPNEPLKSAVFFQFHREIHRRKLMGHCIRTIRYRYCEWPEFHYAPDYRPDWNKIHGTELYDHKIDKEETKNVVGEARYTDTVTELSRRLRVGWRDQKMTNNVSTIPKISSTPHGGSSALHINGNNVLMMLLILLNELCFTLHNH